MKVFNYLVVIIIITSCVKHKSLVILKNELSETVDSTENSILINPYIIQPGDLLNIKVSSIDPSSVAIFNKEVGSGKTNQVNASSIYLASYLVSDSGYINFPIVGKLNLNQHTIMAASKMIEEKLAAYYKFVSVDVKLMSFRVSLLGEVQSPGVYTFYNEKINIIQALSEAGGLTDYANNRKIKIIRQKNNKLKSKIISLKSDDIFNSEFYYLEPNDAIYIEPLKSKVMKINAPSIQVALSLLTFIIVTFNFISK